MTKQNYELIKNHWFWATMISLWDRRDVKFFCFRTLDGWGSEFSPLFGGIMGGPIIESLVVLCKFMVEF